MTVYAEVAINAPSGKTFHYIVPEYLASKLNLFQRVIIPLGFRKTTGFVVSFPKESTIKGLKEIIGLYDPFPVIAQPLFSLANWISKEYCASLGLTLHAMYPGKLKYFPTRKKEWQPECGLIIRNGKNEVSGIEAPLSDRVDYYLKEIENILQEKETVLLLVPEVAHIETFAAQIEERCKSPVIRFSSRLSHGAAFEALKGMLYPFPKVIVATRQAAFLPINGLSTIIVEEENSSAYESDETPRFSTVSAVLKRGELEGLKVLLGSYSLSLNAVNKYPVVLRKSQDYACLELVDFYDKNKVISFKLDNAFKEALKNGGRGVLLATRKGFSTSLRCNDCGETVKCEKCGVGVTIHKEDNTIRCRYCGKKSKIPDSCSSCKGILLYAAGLGVEKAAQEIKKTLKYVPMERIDSELLTKGSEKKAALKRFVDGKTEIIVGTQLAMPYVREMKKGVVGLLGFDYVTNLPSFDSTEKALELVLSILDASNPGVKVFVQVMKKENRIMEALIKKEVEKFKNEELKMREVLKYPPFYRLGEILISGKTEEEAGVRAVEFMDCLARKGDKNVEVLGPIPACLPSKKGKAVQILVKGKTGVSEAVSYAIALLEKKYTNVRKCLDVTIK
ncbi:MAG: primosomal protein N' [Candidatus Firestonebacteria bacterium RIFOXYC2_FULL_39_67]|nr:MAG: primosomal protein N' [Candidatus Firestonebacteria bacterium RIFOXYD2_FULL_39_29]OGF54698.1 MAG: primosomal protein N' [Candidatus Firestonebacteria bacterium RIFOXYC2_FULL_39_67]